MTAVDEERRERRCGEDENEERRSVDAKIQERGYQRCFRLKGPCGCIVLRDVSVASKKLLDETTRVEPGWTLAANDEHKAAQMNLQEPER
jgi:hypothetical protein